MAVCFPCEPITSLTPQPVLLALRRRLPLPWVLRPQQCRPNPGCDGMLDELGGHAYACPRTELLARPVDMIQFSSNLDGSLMFCALCVVCCMCMNEFVCSCVACVARLSGATLRWCIVTPSHQSMSAMNCPICACSSTALTPTHQWRQVPETGRLAAPRIADPYRTLSRSFSPAFLADQFACPSPLRSGTPCRSVALSHIAR